MNFCSLCGHAFEHGMLTPKRICMECVVARMIKARDRIKFTQVSDLFESKV
jgi:DNA-directed RNA polymerase subunit RPC12/RpoP